MSGDRVVIVGGGVIGAACAYYLSAAGRQVTIVDGGEFAGGCSHANCGFLALDHALPLNRPGVVRKALRNALRASSPLYIKPRLSPRLWWWLWRFAFGSGERATHETAKARAALLESSARLFARLHEDERLECEWEHAGLAFVYETRAELEAYAPTARLLAEEYGLPAERYEGDELLRLEPALVPGLAGAWHYAMDSHLRPEKLMASLRGVLEGRGVELRERCRVEGFVRAGERVTAVRTSSGEIACDGCVVAAGAATTRLEKHLGCRIPVQPGKGYSITTARPAVCPSIPMIFEERKVAVTPMRSGYRIGSTLEFSGFDPTLSRRRLDPLLDAARRYLRDPIGDPIEEEWCGWRPMSVDERPIIDFAPGLANVVIATGHGVLGLSMAAGTGKLVAELLAGAEPHVDPRPYALTRF